MAISRFRALGTVEGPMFGALLIHLAVIAAPPVAADVARPNCAAVHCSVTVDENARKEDCAGVHCAAPSDLSAARSANRYDRESLDASHDRAGLNAQNRPYGDGGVDRSFDNQHDANFDRESYDRNGTWPAH
jgi:hypothetical protein